VVFFLAGDGVFLAGGRTEGKIPSEAKQKLWFCFQAGLKQDKSRTPFPILLFGRRRHRDFQLSFLFGGNEWVCFLEVVVPSSPHFLHRAFGRITGKATQEHSEQSLDEVKAKP
jgi:hypothetical protein